MKTSLASPIEMSRSSVCERPIEVAWNDGDHDEPQRADAPAGTDRYWRWTAFGRGRYRADRRWPKTDLPIARGVSSSRRDGLISRKRGRTSNRARGAVFRATVLAIVGEHYADFGPT